jgi:hypothetical protein
VNVDYSDPHSPSGTITSTVRDDPAVWDLDGPTGVAAVSAMANMVFNGQTSYNNIVGSQIKSLVTDVNDSNTTMTSLTSTVCDFPLWSLIVSYDLGGIYPGRRRIQRIRELIAFTCHRSDLDVHTRSFGPVSLARTQPSWMVCPPT